MNQEQLVRILQSIVGMESVIASADEKLMYEYDASFDTHVPELCKRQEEHRTPKERIVKEVCYQVQTKQCLRLHLTFPFVIFPFIGGIHLSFKSF